MTLESHHSAMHAPIRREQMHRIDPPARCSGGSCRQGRAKCETPEACCTPLDDSDDMASLTKAIALAVLLPLTLVIAAGGGSWLFTVFMDWAAPYWPLAANALGAL